MKRWAFLTVLLYALALIILSLPVLSIGMGKWSRDDNLTILAINDNLVKFYSQWAYWLWLAVLVAGQVMLLLLPINIAERRLPARRPLKIPVLVTTFFLANLCFAGIFSILCATLGDHTFDLFNTDHNNQNNNSGSFLIGTMILTMLVFWIIWTLIFFRNFAQTDAPDALLRRCTRWLLRGSILELIIAVPSHVIVRRRDDCCAPIGTFWGIATGLSVMLLCFGPGVFFLFVERWQKLNPKRTETNKNPE